MAMTGHELEVLRDDAVTRLVRVRQGDGADRPALIKHRSGGDADSAAACLHNDYHVVIGSDLPCALALTRLEESGSEARLIFEDPAHELAVELTRRSGGNPFFLWQILRIMRDSGWLYVGGDGCWRWDLGSIRDAGYSEHVLDLIAHRFDALDEGTRELLRWAAALGTSFDLALLGWVTSRDEDALRRDLEPAIDEAFIVALDEHALASPTGEPRQCLFVHDRMQEVAYRSIGEASRPAMHLRRRRCAFLTERCGLRDAHRAGRHRTLPGEGSRTESGCRGAMVICDRLRNRLAFP